MDGQVRESFEHHRAASWCNQDHAHGPAAVVSAGLWDMVGTGPHCPHECTHGMPHPERKVCVCHFIIRSVTYFPDTALFFNWFFKSFLIWTIFSLYWICYNIASALCFGFFGREACGILVPQEGIEPARPALEDKVLTTGPPRSPNTTLLFASYHTQERGPWVYVRPPPQPGLSCPAPGRNSLKPLKCGCCFPWVSAGLSWFLFSLLHVFISGRESWDLSLTCPSHHLTPKMWSRCFLIRRVNG